LISPGIQTINLFSNKRTAIYEKIIIPATIHEIFRSKRGSGMPVINARDMLTTWVRGRKTRANIWMNSGRILSGKKVPENTNIGAMNKVAGYEIVSIDGDIAVKHAAILEKRIPARNDRGIVRIVPIGSATPKIRRIILIEIAEITPRVAPHTISPRITSLNVTGVARIASNVF